MFVPRSEDIELPNSPDNDIDYGNNHGEGGGDEEERGIPKKKKIIIVIAIIAGILIIGLIVFLVIFFSKKNEDGGGVVVKYVLNSENEVKLLNVWNLKNGEYSIESVDSGNTEIRLLEENTYNIENGLLKFNDNKKRIGTIECKIKFKTVLSRMDGMFKDIKNIIKADFSGFKSENVKNMNELFKNCENLDEVNFQKFNSKNVETMDSTFEGCSKLVEVDLSSFETPKLKSMKSTFKDCKNLEYLDATQFYLKNNIVDIDNIFDGIDNAYIKIDNSDSNNLLQSFLNNTHYSTCKQEECQQCIENKCTSCKDGYYLYKSEYVNNCKKCNDNCETCSDSNNCYNCINDSYKIINGFCFLKSSEPKSTIFSTAIEDITNNIPITDDLTEY